MFGDFGGGAADDGGEGAVEIAHAGFAGVVVDDGFDGVGGDAHLFCGHAMLLELPREEIFSGDQELVVLGVAGDVDDFHAVAQGGGNRVHDVGGADEDDVREVKGDAEVMVGEGVVLLGVEHFQEGGGRVAAEIGAELVDFVEHHDGVVGAGLAEFLDDAAGECADVGAAMAADVGFVAHAAQRDAHEVAAQRCGDGFAEAGFADARRADEAEDRAAAHCGLSRRTARNSMMRCLIFSRS